jgi:hypothetical protein
MADPALLVEPTEADLPSRTRPDDGPAQRLDRRHGTGQAWARSRFS